jgi:hypothetical protein
MGDGDIFQGNVKFLGALEEVFADTVADSFTLGDEFSGIELCDDGFEDFVADRGENSLIVILAEVLFACISHIPQIT